MKENNITKEISKRKKVYSKVFLFLGIIFLLIILSYPYKNHDLSSRFIIVLWTLTSFFLIALVIFFILEITLFRKEPIFFQKIKRPLFYLYLFLLSLIPLIILILGIIIYVDIGMALLFFILMPLYYLLIVIINLLSISKYEYKKEISIIRILYSLALFVPPIIIYRIIQNMIKAQFS